MNISRTSSIGSTPRIGGGRRRAHPALLWLLAIGCWLLVVPMLFAGEPAATNSTVDTTEVTRLLADALQQQFVRDGGDLDVRLTRPWTPVSAPAGPLSLKILEIPNRGLTSEFIIAFEILTANGVSLGNWQYPVQAHLWRDVWVARSMLQPGQLVCDADIARERRDVLALHTPLAEFAAGDTTLEIAETVPEGSPLTAFTVKLHPVIRRGQMANALIQDGALTVSVKVQSLEDGTPGQVIRLRNLDTSHDFSGKVIDAATVLVPL